MWTSAMRAHGMLPGLPPETAVDFENPAVSGVGDFCLLYIPRHTGFSPWCVPRYPGTALAPLEPILAPSLQGHFPRFPRGQCHPHSQLSPRASSFLFHVSPRCASLCPAPRQYPPPSSLSSQKGWKAGTRAPESLIYLLDLVFPLEGG